MKRHRPGGLRLFTQSTWGTALNFANTPATFTATTFNKEKIEHPTTGVPAYDANGNIQYLQRYSTTGAISDNFTYNYTANTNKLSSVVHNTGSGNQTYASYLYDEIGQLTYENTLTAANKKYIKYDVAGKVVLVARDANFTQKVVEYAYNELGQRIVKKSYNPSTYQLSQTTFYVGGAIYTQLGTAGAVILQEHELDGGIGRIGTFYRPTPIYAYEMSDHLGNVRAVVARNAGNLEVRMYTDYYPYGMVLQSGGTSYRYQYQGQYSEKDGETDWNAFELRMYDSRIARWLSVDPKNQYHSPYVSVGNNPISTIDRDGGKGESTDVKRNKDGSFTVVGAHNDNDRNVYVVGDDMKRTGEIIGTTRYATSFMIPNDQTGGFRYNQNNKPLFAAVTFSLENMQNGQDIMSSPLASFTAIASSLQSEIKSLGVLAALSYPGGPYDLKAHYESQFTPVMFEGNITPMRELGNILFGKNLRTINRVTITQLLVHPKDFYKSAMPIIGKFNQWDSDGNGYNAGYPYYGEHTYSGRNIYYGYFGKQF